MGFWRLLRAFRERELETTFGVCAQALERNPEIAGALRDGGDDICAHGRRFARHWTMDEATERAEIAAALEGIEALLGRAATGWQSRYSASVATRRLLAEHEALLYDADAYNDDLPYWTPVGTRRRLVVPHSFTNNDNRLGSARLATGDDFFDHLRAAFRVLREEGGRMMTVSLHPRVSGQPARFDGLRHFLDLVCRTPGVLGRLAWCRRTGIGGACILREIRDDPRAPRDHGDGRAAPPPRSEPPAACSPRA